MDWFVFPLAALSGFFMTLSAVVLAYPNHRKTQTGIDPGSCKKVIFVALNFAFTGLAQVAQIWSSRFAPVSIVFPVFVGSNILTNAILQVSLGITRITKTMLIGSVGLATAVATLHDIGPKDVAHGMSNSEVLAMLSTMSSLLFLCVSVVMQLVVFYALARGLIADDSKKCFAYAYGGGVGSIINAAIGKLIQMDIGLGLMIPLVVVYIIQAVLCMANAVWANGTLKDPSRFVPVSSGMNLTIVCIAGLCIWGDGSRIDYPLTYIMVYFWVLLSMYSLSTFDLFGESSTSQDASFFSGADSRIVRTGPADPRPLSGVNLAEVV